MSRIPEQNGDPISPLFNTNPATGGDIATSEGVRRWVLEGLAQGATHTIVWCDTYDYTDYEEHVMPDQDVRAIVNEKNGTNMRKLLEVYWLAGDLEAQLAQGGFSVEYGPETE